MPDSAWAAPALQQHRKIAATNDLAIIRNLQRNDREAAHSHWQRGIDMAGKWPLDGYRRGDRTPKKASGFTGPTPAVQLAVNPGLFRACSGLVQTGATARARP
jgi:hypothetical protein